MFKGACIKVKDNLWSKALEQIIASNIQSFCVNSSEDARKLYDIMVEIYGTDRKPNISTSKFYNKMHDVSKLKVVAPEGFITALDGLTITDSVVANFLIDNCRLESILLASSHGT